MKSAETLDLGEDRVYSYVSECSLTQMTDTKTKISNAALSLFIKKGIKGATVREISKRARIAEGTIYRHFKSKNDLALRLFLVHLESFRKRLADSVSNSSSPRDKLETLIKTFFEFAREKPEAYSYIMVGHHTELKNVPRGTLKPKDVFVDVIRDGIEKGEFRDIDEELGAALIIGMATRAIMFIEEGLCGDDFEGAVSEVVESSLRILAR
jgi:AcrR family transcriptional regulator